MFLFFICWIDWPTVLCVVSTRSWWDHCWLPRITDASGDALTVDADLTAPPAPLTPNAQKLRFASCHGRGAVYELFVFVLFVVVSLSINPSAKQAVFRECLSQSSCAFSSFVRRPFFSSMARVTQHRSRGWYRSLCPLHPPAEIILSRVFFAVFPPALFLHPFRATARASSDVGGRAGDGFEFR